MIICEFEDGGKGKLRHLTANALIIKDGKILLAKRGTYGGGKPLSEAGKWSLVGGFMGRDETIEQAMRREVKEEAGLDIKNPQLFHIKDRPDRPHEDRQNVEFVYLAEAVGEMNDEDEEVSALEWFSLENLPAKEEVAFDHYDDLILYKNYLNEKFQLPIIG